MPRRVSRKTKAPSKKKQMRKRKVYKTIPMRGFPSTALVQLSSEHLVSLNPAANVTAYVSLNINNPIDPIDTTNSSGLTLISSEHHPSYWNCYEAVYGRFQVISAQAQVYFMHNNITASSAHFITCAPSITADDVRTILGNNFTFATKLRELYGRNSFIKYGTNGTGSNSVMVKLSKRCNIAKLESLDNKDATLMGKTSANDSESAPSRSPQIIAGFGCLRSGTDLGQVECRVRINYVIRFSDLAEASQTNV